MVLSHCSKSLHRHLRRDKRKVYVKNIEERLEDAQLAYIEEEETLCIRSAVEALKTPDEM